MLVSRVDPSLRSSNSIPDVESLQLHQQPPGEASVTATSAARKKLRRTPQQTGESSHRAIFEGARAQRIHLDTLRSTLKDASRNLEQAGPFRVQSEHHLVFTLTLRDLLAWRATETPFTQQGAEFARRLRAKHLNGDAWFVSEKSAPELQELVDRLRDLGELSLPRIVAWHPQRAVLTEDHRTVTPAEHLASEINRMAQKQDPTHSAPHRVDELGKYALFYNVGSVHDATPLLGDKPLSGAKLLSFRNLQEAGALHFGEALNFERRAHSAPDAASANTLLYAMHQEIGNAVACRKAVAELTGETWTTAVERTVSSSSKTASVSSSRAHSIDAVGRKQTGQDITALHRAASLPISSPQFEMEHDSAAQRARSSPNQRLARERSSGSQGYFADHGSLESTSEQSSATIPSLNEDDERTVHDALQAYYKEQPDYMSDGGNEFEAGA